MDDLIRFSQVTMQVVNERIFLSRPDASADTGEQASKNEMVIATLGRVKSLITKPQSEMVVKIGTPIKVRGHAWTGEGKVDKDHISTDFGIRWQEARLI